MLHSTNRGQQHVAGHPKPIECEAGELADGEKSVNKFTFICFVHFICVDFFIFNSYFMHKHSIKETPPSV